tara:strand:+ start:256 stop:414 length:159 start_codon:yes stop_codon:yes gene_type:complete
MHNDIEYNEVKYIEREIEGKSGECDLVVTSTHLKIKPGKASHLASGLAPSVL